jgi:hypothetical protein
MRDWQIKWPPARPRWGTFSVQAHLDLRRLITDVLLYDALVFPTPVDDADVERWNEKEWNPELLALRINQLGDAAFATPWDAGLRATWSKEFEQHAREFPDDPTLAFDLTAAVMAAQSFARLVGPQDDRVGEVAADPPERYPVFAARDARARVKAGGAALELVAAFQDVRQARRVAGAIGDDATRPLYPLPDEGVRLRLELAVPEDADEDTFHRALDVIGDDDFRAARRRLWSWEEQISADRLDEAAIRLALDALVADYNAAVARHVRKTRQQSVFLLVPAGLGIALDYAVGGGVAGKVIGAGVNFVAHKVKAKFPLLGETGDAVSHHPGSAVSRALSIMAHD